MENTPFTDPKTDKYYQKMQQMYDKLSKIAREVVFIPGYQVKVEMKSPFNYMIRQLYHNKSLDIFRIPVEVCIYFFLSNKEKN